eukprot:2850432-Karenia_brevis.AAC.1
MSPSIPLYPLRASVCVSEAACARETMLFSQLDGIRLQRLHECFFSPRLWMLLRVASVRPVPR